MKRLLPFFLLSLLLIRTIHVYAQEFTTQITESATNRSIRGEFVESSNDNFAIFGTANYRFDSTRHFMLGLDSSLLTNGKQGVFRLSNYGQFNDVEPAGDDFLISGTNSASFGSQPYIIKVDENFQPLWSVYFQNLALSQKQIRRTFSEGNQITAYSYSSPADDIAYRIETNQNRSSFNTSSLSSAAKDFRFYEGASTTIPGTHLLAGTCQDKVSNDRDGILISWGNNGLNWGKSYDLGVDRQQEEFSRIIPSLDNQWLATAIHYLQDSARFESFVLKLNSHGNIIWCKKLLIYGATTSLPVIAQTHDGDILVGGFTYNFEASLVKLDSTGNLLWSKKWTPPSPGANDVGNIFRASSGKIMLMIASDGQFPTQLDSTGNGCMFEQDIPLQSQPFSDYQVTSLNLTTAPFTVMTDSTSILPRQLNFSSSTYCGTTDLETKLSDIGITLFPQPAHEQLFIRSKPPLRNATISIYNLEGKLELAMPFQEQISVATLSSGIKVLVLQADKGIAVKRFLKR